MSHIVRAGELIQLDVRVDVSAVCARRDEHEAVCLLCYSGSSAACIPLMGRKGLIKFFCIVPTQLRPSEDGADEAAIPLCIDLYVTNPSQRVGDNKRCVFLAKSSAYGGGGEYRSTVVRPKNNATNKNKGAAETTVRLVSPVLEDDSIETKVFVSMWRHKPPAATEADARIKWPLIVFPNVHDLAKEETARVNRLTDVVLETHSHAAPPARGRKGVGVRKVPGRDPKYDNLPHIAWVAGNRGDWGTTPMSIATYVGGLMSEMHLHYESDLEDMYEEYRKLLAAESKVRVPARFLLPTQYRGPRVDVGAAEMENIIAYVNAMRTPSLCAEYVEDSAYNATMGDDASKYRKTGGIRPSVDVWSTLPDMSGILELGYTQCGDCEDKVSMFIANYLRGLYVWQHCDRAKEFRAVVEEAHNWVPALVVGALAEETAGHAWAVVIHLDDLREIEARGEWRRGGSDSKLTGIRFLHVECVQPVHVWPYHRQRRPLALGVHTFSDIAHYDASPNEVLRGEQKEDPGTYSGVWSITVARHDIGGAVQQWVVSEPGTPAFLSEYDVFVRGKGKWTRVHDDVRDTAGGSRSLEVVRRYYTRARNIMPVTDYKYSFLAGGKPATSNFRTDLRDNEFYTFFDSIMEPADSSDREFRLGAQYKRAVKLRTA